MPHSIAEPALDERMSQMRRAEAPLSIDLVHLSRQTLGDTRLETELLRLFDRQAQDFFARVASKSEPLSRADLAHSLKGSARAVGAFALADAAERFEDAARNDASILDACRRDLEAAITRARVDIAQLI